jgi:hypothetical protein
VTLCQHLPYQVSAFAVQFTDVTEQFSGLRRIHAVLQGVLVALWCAGRLAAVHPASAVLHCRALAWCDLPGLRSASWRCHKRPLHGVVTRFIHEPLPPLWHRLSPGRRHEH